MIHVVLFMFITLTPFVPILDPQILYLEVLDRFDEDDQDYYCK